MASQFIIDSDRLDGYPCIYGQSDPVDISYDVSLYNILLYGNFEMINGHWYDYPSIRDTQTTTTIPYETLSEFDILLYGNFEMNENKGWGYPSIETFPLNHIDSFGAFSNCHNLEKIVIPKSVLYIEDYAFWNTSLTKVEINPECVYFEHSFPEDCEIEFYE